MSRPIRSKLQKLPQTRARLVAAAVIGCFATVPAWAQKTVTAADLQATKIGNFTAVNVANGVEVQNLANKTMATAGSFHVLAGQTFNIKQGVNDAFMVKVTGIDRDGAKILQQSVIEGRITSPGQFWLQNAAGTIIKPGAVIDVARFVASLGITDANFLAGKLTFENPANGGTIINQGTITTSSGGSVYLVGTEVSNEGVIRTPGGEAILAAGAKVELIDTATPGVKVEITGAAGNVTNLGTILADAGRIGMVGAVVRNSGTLDASSGIETAKVVSEGGRIFLKASKDAYVDRAGRIVATGTKGGKIEVLGERVAVMDKAQIDASGANGGGTVLVGGDYQGKNADVQNATVTYFGKEASIKADATDHGDGGKVIVWADDTTRAYGTISARGGANGGNGGFVEVSGKRYLDYHAVSDLRAPRGRSGTLLLDPSNISIVAGGTTDASYGGGDNTYFNTAGGTSTVLTWADIQAQLGFGNLMVYAQDSGGGYISVNGSPFDATELVLTRTYGNWPTHNVYNSDSKLSLLADGQIFVNASFGNRGSGAIDIMAGWNGSLATPDVASAFNAGKDIIIKAQIATNGALTLKAGDTVKFQNTGNVYSGIEMNSGALTVVADKLILDATAYGGGGYTSSVRIASGGDQTFDIGRSGGAGQVLLDGNDAASAYGGSAAIVRYSGTGGGQVFNLHYGADVTLNGGNGAGQYNHSITNQWTGDCTYAVVCSSNYAEIENRGAGGQTFYSTAAGTVITLTAGGAGNGNSAEIHNESGLQTITGSTAANRPTLTLSGGAGGGDAQYVGGKLRWYENGAWLDSEYGSQAIEVQSLSLTGGAAAYGGASVDGVAQTITVGYDGFYGDLVMTAGNAGSPIAHAYGEYLDYGSVHIGSDKTGASLNLTVYGDLAMTGSSNLDGFGGSIAGIGARKVSINDTINVYGDVTMTSGGNAGSALISSHGYGGSITLRAGLSGTGFMSLGDSYIGTGSTGSVTLEDNGAGAGITQTANGKIETNSLTVKTAAPGAGAITLQGLNRATYVNLDAIGSVTYRSYQSFHLTSAKSANSFVSVSATSGSPYGGDIAVGTVATTTANTASITAYGGIYDDNTIGIANIDAGTINLTAYGGHAGDLAISADVKNASSITAVVGTPSTYGGIRIYNVGNVEPTNVTLTDQSMSLGSGTVLYTSINDINMATSTFNLSSYYGGITLWSGGFLTLGSPGEFSPGVFANSAYGYVNAWGQTGVATGANLNFATAIDLYVGTNGTMTVGHGISNVRNIGLYAAGSLNFLSGSSINATTNAYIGGAASSLVGAATSSTYGGGSITMTNSSVRAASGVVAAYSGGDIRLNDGSYLRGGQGVNLGLGGASSTLYLNDSASYANPSYVLADTGTINIAMPGRSAEGVVIDGAATGTSTAYGSGLFVGTHGTPAIKDSNLNIVYGLAATQAITTVVAEVVNSIGTTITSTSDSSSSTGGGTLAPLLPPSGGGTAGLASLTTGTVGGGTGEFGGSETTTGTVTTTTTTPTTSTSTETSGTSGSADSGSASTSGDQNGSKESKDAKDDKKEDKKDDKSKKADSGDKKDDKSKSKPVGKCSA